MLYNLERTSQGVTATPTGQDDGAILSEVRSHGRQHGGDLRTDQHDGTSAISGARAQMRGFLADIAKIAANTHGTALPDQARLDSIAGTLAEASGYSRTDSGDWGHGLVRTDASSYFDGELVDRNGQLRRPKQKKRAFSEGLATRSVDAYAEQYETRFVAYEGNIEQMKAGSRSTGVANAQGGASRKSIHSFGTSTRTEWLAVLQGSRSAMNRAAENAEAVRRLFADFHESLLVKGVGDGTNFWGLGDLPVVRLALTEDYSSPVDLSDIFADLSAQINALMEAHEDRGDSPTDLHMGSRLMRKISPSSNFTAGGDMTAADLREKLGRLFDDTGIQRFVMTPSLNRWGGDDTLDACILSRPDGENGLHQVMAMPPSPVRSASTLYGDETLWVMRSGGLDISDATDTAIITAKVA